MRNYSNIYTKDQAYRAIIQLRPMNDKAYDYILDLIEKRNDCFINKEEKLKTGVDIYINNNSFAVAIGKKLKDKFKGTLKLSRKLHSRDRVSSKPLYRVTVCFRLNQ